MATRQSGCGACWTGGWRRKSTSAGDYSIADMAIWPWAARFEWQRIDMNEFPNVKRWYKAIAARPAVKAGFKVPNPDREIPHVD